MKKILLTLLLLITSITLVACDTKPEGDPKAVLEKHYSLILAKDYKGAYDLLDENSKKAITLEDFSEFNEVVSKTESNTKYTFSNPVEHKDTILNDIEFSYFTEFEVSRSWKDLLTNKNENVNAEVCVVEEDGKWKVYDVDKTFNPKKEIASAYSYLGNMYLEKDNKEAVTAFNSAIEYEKENPSHYYDLGYALMMDGNYDESINALNKSMELSKDNKELSSDIQVVLGLVFGEKSDLVKAKECFNKALELNPDNSDAKDMLQEF